jgi:hypothetical protein
MNFSTQAQILQIGGPDKLSGCGAQEEQLSAHHDGTHFNDQVGLEIVIF